jgi:hypothetical protein
MVCTLASGRTSANSHKSGKVSVVVLKKSSIGGKQTLDYFLDYRGTLVLHLGGVGEYMS